MSRPDPISDEDVHAYIDGELTEPRMAAVEAALGADPALAARVAAYRRDKAALAAAFRAVAEAPLPAAWLARIEAATERAPRPRRRAAWAVALAASIVLAVGTALLWPRNGPAGSILAEAELARHHETMPLVRLAGNGLADAAGRDALVSRAVGLPLRAPDLARLGWRLAEIDTYAGAAALRYGSADGRALTLFVRRSTGAPRFDLLRNGALRTCIWQDEVVAAVMTGEMTAGQMMRVAGAAYVAMNL